MNKLSTKIAKQIKECKDDRFESNLITLVNETIEGGYFDGGMFVPCENGLNELFDYVRTELGIEEPIENE